MGRYDCRNNAFDWDYCMRLQPRAPVIARAHERVPLALCSRWQIIHYAQYKSWRGKGVAYETQESVYNKPNRTLIGAATGRALEHYDRTGNKQASMKRMTGTSSALPAAGLQQGRSVEVRGYWGDITTGPFFSYGVQADAERLFEVTNKQQKHNTLDVALVRTGFGLASALHETTLWYRSTLSSQLYHNHDSYALFAPQEMFNSSHFRNTEEASTGNGSQVVPENAASGPSNPAGQESARLYALPTNSMESHHMPSGWLPFLVSHQPLSVTCLLRFLHACVDPRTQKFGCMSESLSRLAGRVRIRFSTGSLVSPCEAKHFIENKNMQQRFDVVTIGSRFPQAIADGIARIMTPAGVVCLETCRNMVRPTPFRCLNGCFCEARGGVE
eukprot:scaffold1298_cov382-Prasinococcus_capsulatus_cf.AAC.13